MHHRIRSAGSHAVTILRNIAGVFLILLGIVSGFVPILQGWIFILVGISLLKFPGKDKLIRRFKRLRWIRPFAERYDRLKNRVKKR